MKNWQAFLELKQSIDDFNECCPLLESLANKALIDRHWEQVGDLCGCKFDIHNENFLLRNIMEAPLLQHKEVFFSSKCYFIVSLIFKLFKLQIEFSIVFVAAAGILHSTQK